MFLFSINNSSIKDKLLSFNVKELKVSSFIITIVTDDFLSQYISESDGFSVIESPLISKDDFKDVIFSQIKFRKFDNSFELFRSTMSGPIYYHTNSEGEFFCSTHISMLRRAGVKIEENREVLPEFFIYRNVIPPSTLYRNISLLSIGGRLLIELVHDGCKIHSVDSFKGSRIDHGVNSVKNISQQVFKKLTKSIDRLSPYKSKIALLLSGGVDSSILSRICLNELGLDESYSTVYPFEDPKLNIEKKYALSAAKALGMNHHLYEATEHDYLSGFLETISLAEEPIHHLQSVCFHLLFKKGISDNKIILINGHGVGLPYGHFHNSFIYMKDKMIVRIFSKKPLKEFLKTASRISGKGKRFINILEKSASKYSLSDPENPIWSWLGYASRKWAYNYFKATKEDVIKGRYNLMKKFEDKSIYDIWALYTLSSDEDITLSRWAKIGEGNKKIFYCPYMDSEVLNDVFSIPWKLKLKGKDLLQKEIARGCKIPEFIIKRPKTGFGVKRKDWALQGGVFEPLVPLAAKAFDEKEIRNVQSTDPEKAMTFWNMLNYALWKRLCIDNEPLSRLQSELDEEFMARP